MSNSSFYVVVLFIILIGMVFAFQAMPTTMFTQSEMTFLYIGVFIALCLTVVGSFKVMLK